MKEALISVAAGREQLPLIEKAKEMGFKVIAVDRDSQAPGFSLADEVINTSTHDPKAIIEQLRPLRGKYRFHGVLTKSSGVPVVATAEIAHEFSLPGISLDCARSALTKPSLMNMCDEARIPVPKHFAASSFRQIKDARIPFPVVLKPSLTIAGKEGISLAKDAEGLETKFRLAQKASLDGIVEVEEFVAGPDVVFAGFFLDSVLYPIALIDELTRFGEDDQVRGMGFAIPSVFSDTPIEKRIIKLAQDFVTRPQLGTGICFIAFRIRSSEKPVLIEVHLDLAGDLVVDKLFPASTHFDLLKTAIQLLTGRPFEMPAIQFRPTTIYYLMESDLQSHRQEKLQELNRLPGIEKWNWAASPTGKGRRKRVGYFLVRSESVSTNDTTIKKIDKVLQRKTISIGVREPFGLSRYVRESEPGDYLKV